MAAPTQQTIPNMSLAASIVAAPTTVEVRSAIAPRAQERVRTAWGSNGDYSGAQAYHKLLNEGRVDACIHERNGTAAVFSSFSHLEWCTLKKLR
jgi:hypothetical protein